MTYGFFSGYADYRTDMRNSNQGIKLWLIPSSDYAADMRKSTTCNDLRRHPLVATTVIAVRVPPRLARRLALGR